MARKKADIALFENGSQSPSALIEFKHNFSFQLKYITGAEFKAWERCGFTWPKDRQRIGRIEEDQKKWADSGIGLFYIQIITNITKLDSKLACYCKYRKIYEKNSNGDMKAIKAYFSNLSNYEKKAKWKNLKVHEVTASCKSPFAITAQIYFYILESSV